MCGAREGPQRDPEHAAGQAGWLRDCGVPAGWWVVWSRRGLAVSSRQPFRMGRQAAASDVRGGGRNEHVRCRSVERRSLLVQQTELQEPASVAGSSEYLDDSSHSFGAVHMFADRWLALATGRPAGPCGPIDAQIHRIGRVRVGSGFPGLPQGSPLQRTYGDAPQVARPGSCRDPATAWRDPRSQPPC
jgi:hypothetical protein